MGTKNATSELSRLKGQARKLEKIKSNADFSDFAGEVFAKILPNESDREYYFYLFDQLIFHIENNKITIIFKNTEKNKSAASRAEIPHACEFEENSSMLELCAKIESSLSKNNIKYCKYFDGSKRKFINVVMNTK